jgi:hypothetical protein
MHTTDLTFKIKKKQELSKLICNIIEEKHPDEVYRYKRYHVHMGVQLIESTHSFEDLLEELRKRLRATDKYHNFEHEGKYYLMLLYPHSDHAGCDRISQKIFHFFSHSMPNGNRVLSSFTLLENDDLLKLINNLLTGIEMVERKEGSHLTHYSYEDHSNHIFY